MIQNGRHDRPNENFCNFDTNVLWLAVYKNGEENNSNICNNDQITDIYIYKLDLKSSGLVNFGLFFFNTSVRDCERLR